MGLGGIVWPKQRGTKPRDRGEGMGKGGSIAGFEGYCGFREGWRCFGRGFEGMDPPGSGVKWAFWGCFWVNFSENMVHYYFHKGAHLTPHISPIFRQLPTNHFYFAVRLFPLATRLRTEIRLLALGYPLRAPFEQLRRSGIPIRMGGHP